MLSARRSQEKQKTQTILYPESISRKSKSIIPSQHSAHSSGKSKFIPSHQREKSIRQQSGKSQKRLRSRMGSVAQKCLSQIEYRSGLGQPSSRNEVDRQTQINRVEDKSMKRQIESELEHEEMVRQGLVKQNLAGQPIETEKNKIKIGSRFRRQLVAPVLQETKQIDSTKPNSSSFAVKKAEQQEYDQIVNDIRLNGLQSKVVNVHKISSKAESFLSVLPQSESSIINTPGAARTNVKNNNLSPDAKSETEPFRIPQNKLLDHLHRPQASADSRSLLSVNSEEAEAINESVNKMIENKMASSKQVQINIHDGMSRPGDNKAQTLIKKNQHFEQSMVMIATKPNIAKQQSIKTARSRQHMLTIISSVISFHVIGENRNKEEIQKERLNAELVELRKTVRELRLERIKAKADKMEFYQSMHAVSRTISYDTEQAKHRYEAYDSQLGCDSSQKNSSNSKETRLYFGKIRKNRSISRQKSNSTYLLEELRHQKSHQIPAPLINIHKLKNQRLAASEQKTSVLSFPEADNISKQYKTMFLERITEQNLEQSMKFSAPFAPSIDKNYYRSNLANNKVNIRGQQIGENVLNKFQSNDRKFKTFIKRQSSKNRLKTNKSHAEETINLINNPEISKQPTEFAASVSEEQIFEGTIIRNFKKQPHFKSENSDQSRNHLNNQNYELIKESENVELTKRQIEFLQTQIPPFSEIPNQHTSNEQLMDLVLTILPLSDQRYNEEEMTECTLKKYKNCIMFQLSPSSHFRIVWHFTGRLYFGQWDSVKNQKNGQGVQFFKNKFYYKGGFNNGKKEGKGIMINCNGSIYEGQWVNGEKQGYGRQYNSEQISYYEGSWSHGKKEGHGHYEYSENVYEGTFENNLKSGFGIEIFENGDKYVGQYLRGKFHGEGKYIWRTGAFYFGQFSEGFKQGNGKWQSSLSNFDIYEGEYNKDKKHGHGKYAWSNRCIYQGLFENDLKHGIGSIQYPDGRYMQGVWTLGILTEVISKVSEAHKEEPLEQPKIRSHTKVAMRLAGPTLKL